MHYGLVYDISSAYSRWRIRDTISTSGAKEQPIRRLYLNRLISPFPQTCNSIFHNIIHQSHEPTCSAAIFRCQYFTGMTIIKKSAKRIQRDRKWISEFKERKMTYTVSISWHKGYNFQKTKQMFDCKTYQYEGSRK